MKLHPESHLDHDLSNAQRDHLLARFADRTGFFIETFELPAELGTVPCGLYGPAMGDDPVGDDAVIRERRGTRKYASRMIVAPMRPTRMITVIAGPHVEGDVSHACILYTAFGGPSAPQEPGDIRAQLEAAEAQRRERDRVSGDPAASLVLCHGEDGYEAARAALDPIYGKIVALRVKRAASDAYWSEHALATETNL